MLDPGRIARQNAGRAEAARPPESGAREETMLLKKTITLLFPPLLIALVIVGVMLMRAPRPAPVTAPPPPTAPPARTTGPAASPSPIPSPSPEPTPDPDRYSKALERYVARRDREFAWEKIHEFDRPRYTGHVLKMISQRWHSSPGVSLPLWEHVMVVMIPKELDPNDDRAMLFVTGMSNMPAPLPEEGSQMAALICVNTGSIVAELRMVPNQPIQFDGDYVNRFEDDLIAKTWAKFLETGDPTWPIQVPMTKAVVRGMDALQDFLANDAPGRHPVDKFTLLGGRNRAWSAWLAAAVDTRVIGLASLVCDEIDYPASLDHQFRTFGEWSIWMNDYIAHDILARRDTPRFDDLMTVVSIHNYLDRIIVPKYIISTSGDELSPPDPPGGWPARLRGETYFRVIPNASHSLGRTDVISSLISWQGSMLRGKSRPVFREEEQADGSVHIYCNDLPHVVNLWTATNPEARDFRFETQGKIFKSETLEPHSPGVYILRPTAPEKGWSAMFAELIYVSGERYPYTYTTRVRILPEVYDDGTAVSPAE